jgi:hypothetical protein
MSLPQVTFQILVDTEECPDRLITSKDHASVQISIADVDSNGRALPTSTTFALCGQVRSQGESDDAMNRLATRAGCEPRFSFTRKDCANLSYSAPECMVVPKVIERCYTSVFLYHVTIRSLQYSTLRKHDGSQVCTCLGINVDSFLIGLQSTKIILQVYIKPKPYLHQSGILLTSK